MCTGVLIGLAGVKFSGSISIEGAYMFIIININKMISILFMSLKVKYG
jgi:hypothetical protein